MTLASAQAFNCLVFQNLTNTLHYYDKPVITLGAATRGSYHVKPFLYADLSDACTHEPRTQYSDGVCLGNDLACTSKRVKRKDLEMIGV